LGILTILCLLINIFNQIWNRKAIHEMLFLDTDKFNLGSRFQLSNNKSANRSVLAVTCVNLLISVISVPILVIRLDVDQKSSEILISLINMLQQSYCLLSALAFILTDKDVLEKLGKFAACFTNLIKTRTNSVTPVVNEKLSKKATKYFDELNEMWN